MRAIVVYKSITGFTKKYAEWISKELSADCVPLDEIERVAITEYDLVVYGGSLRAGSINGYRRFKRLIKRIGPDKVVIFAVGEGHSVVLPAGRLRLLQARACDQNLDEADQVGSHVQEGQNP